MASAMPTKNSSNGVNQPPSKATRHRRRLSPAVREQEILSGAIEYFATFGFEGQIRGLAAQLGVSQGLIYRYFPSKEDLIDRVYQVVFLNRWSDEWDRVLKDRGTPLQVRLIALYKSYYATVDRYDVIRISLSSALRGEKIGINYLEYVRQELIIPIAEEIRAEFGLPSPLARPISILEEQIVYSLHAKFLYSLTRKHVYGHDTGTNMNFLIQIYVDAFFNSLEMSITRIFKLEDAENIANRVGASVD
tara:strand:+ start:498 stop:1241 length:744 start_codon:yes stop_codon:yes gene_type:complete